MPSHCRVLSLKHLSNRDCNVAIASRLVATAFCAIVVDMVELLIRGTLETDAIVEYDEVVYVQLQQRCTCGAMDSSCTAWNVIASNSVG